MKPINWPLFQLSWKKQKVSKVHKIEWVQRDGRNGSNQLTIASVIMEEAERVAKNRISTADGHCVYYEQLYSREMQKEP